MGFNLFQKEKANVLLSKAFSSYVDKGLLDTILKNQESLNLLGEQKKISIIFSDIKGYTELSNTFPPQVILETLREYLDIMVTQITFNGGTVDKIMGDGIMALFNAPIDLPNYSEKSLKAALNMQKSMVQLQKKWHLEGKTNLTIRIGIATNTVFVGNLGSEDHLEYTAIGNAVNLAARLESSSPPGGILVCKETYKLNKNTFNFRPISGLNLKGFKKGYTAYLVQSLFNNENQNENLISKGDLNKKERRDELRFEQNIPIEIQFHKNSYSGNIINHSVSGLSFFSKKVFEINQTISISINLTSFLDSNIDIFENNFEAKNALIYVELKITWSELDLINLYGGKIQHYRCQSKKLIN